MKITRELAYTTPRPDVFAMVPKFAKQILDVGCSNGALGASLRAAVPGRQVIGIEGDRDLLEKARSQLDSVLCADLNVFDWEAEFPDTKFDSIIFADVLEHLLDPLHHVKAARRLLSQEGALVISLPNIRHISALYSIFVAGTFPRRQRGIFDSTHLRWFTIRDARSLLSDADMRITKMNYSLRLRDQGGGFMNKATSKLLDPIQSFGPIRELLTYQFCIRAVRA